jgi:hypothetical protein
MNKFIVIAVDRYQRKDESSLPKKPALVSSKTADRGYNPILVDQQGLGGTQAQQGLGGTQAMPQMEPRPEDATLPPPAPPPGRRKAKKIKNWLSY